MALFKRPAWAKTHSSGDAVEAEDSFFKHSSRSYQEIVAEEHRKRKERAEKQKAIAERKTSEDVHQANKERVRSPKRRRITLEEGEDLLKSAGLGSVEISDDDECDDNGDAAGPSSKLPVRRSPRFSKTVDRVGTRSRALPLSGDEVVEIVEDLDDDSYIPKARPRASEPEEEPESDEELAELKRRARERRRKREEQKMDTPTTVVRARVGQPGPATNTTTTLLDPPIKLLVSSELPNTQPLIVFRRLSQRLKEIREVWCQKQGFSEAQIQEAFMIHNMKRVYDVTTCKSLGLDVDKDGIVTMRGAEGMDELDKVHLEVVTEELFARMKVERAREERQRRGLQEVVPAAEVGTGEDAVATEVSKEEQLIKIFLRAKGQEPYRLKVKPSTLFSKIISACKKNFEFSEEQEVWLEFDGDRLDPTAEVRSAEIEDMDSIDVHVS